MRGKSVAPSFLAALATAALLLLAGAAGAADLSFLWSNEPTSTRSTRAPRPATEKAGSCDGIGDGIWNGCRGTGCHVCQEKLAGYDCYFLNHPDCIRNTTCANQFYSCDSACPAPTAADRCSFVRCSDYSNNPSLCQSNGCRYSPGYCSGFHDQNGHPCWSYDWDPWGCMFAYGSCWWVSGYCY